VSGQRRRGPWRGISIRRQSDRQTELATGEDGFFSFEAKEQRGCLIRARQKWAANWPLKMSFYSYVQGKPSPYHRRFFFTDREFIGRGQPSRTKVFA